jgi:hypothetical protein
MSGAIMRLLRSRERSKKDTKMLRAIVILSVVALSGCIDPRRFESTPVEVETASGVVTCQLYTPGMVIWDRAINRPEDMSVEEADEICSEEGLRRSQRR